MKGINLIGIAAIVIVALLIVFGIILSTPPPTKGVPLPYGWSAFDDIDSTIWVFKGGNSPSLSSAIANCQTGGMVYVLPGVYSEENITVSNDVVGSYLGAVTWYGVDTLWTLGAEDVHFENIIFQWSGDAGSGLVAGNYRWSATNCIFQGRVWDMSCDSAIFKNCQFLPLAANGWTKSSGTLQFYRCQFGRDIPKMVGDPDYSGIKQTGTGAISAWYTDFFTTLDTTMHLKGNGTRLFAFQCRFVNDAHPCVVCEDTTIASLKYTAFEGPDDATNAPVLAYDTSNINIEYCELHRAGFPTNRTVLVTQTAAAVKSQNNTYYGGVNVDSGKTIAGAVRGTVNTAEFIGDLILGNFKDCDGGNGFGAHMLRRGEPSGPVWYGSDAFASGTSISDTLLIPGINGTNCYVQVTTYVKGLGDRLSAYLNTDTLFVVRDTGATRVNELPYHFEIRKGK